MFDYDHKLIVEKDKTEVELVFVNGNKQYGHFFLKKFQRVTDLLNDERIFLPFEDKSGSLHMINKNHIVQVNPSHQDAGGRSAEAMSIAVSS